MKKIDVQSMTDVWFSISVTANAVKRINASAAHPTLTEVADTLEEIALNLGRMGFNDEYTEELSEEAIEKTITGFIPAGEIEESYRSNQAATLEVLAKMLGDCKEVFFEKLEAEQLSGKNLVEDESDENELDLTEEFNKMIDCQQDLLELA